MGGLDMHDQSAGITDRLENKLAHHTAEAAKHRRAMNDIATAHHRNVRDDPQWRNVRVAVGGHEAHLKHAMRRAWHEKKANRYAAILGVPTRVHHPENYFDPFRNPRRSGNHDVRGRRGDPAYFKV